MDCLGCPAWLVTPLSMSCINSGISRPEYHLQADNSRQEFQDLHSMRMSARMLVRNINIPHLCHIRFAECPMVGMGRVASGKELEDVTVRALKVASEKQYQRIMCLQDGWAK